MMLDKKSLTTLEEVKAFSDPYRLQIIGCYKNIGKPATVKQIADTLKEVPANIYYHVKKLEKFGILKLSYTEEIKGIVAKYYELTAHKFSIEYSNMKDVSDELINSESKKMIINIYEDSKNQVLDILEKENNNLEKNEMTGQLYLENVYLTKKDALELCEYISNLCEKNKGKSKEKQRHHLFFSLIPNKKEE